MTSRRNTRLLVQSSSVVTTAGSAEVPQESAKGRFGTGFRRVVSLTILSRVLGAVRDMATAGLFGLGPVMDAFSVAFRIPNLARRLFGEGALAAAFVPAFAREYDRSAAHGRISAWQLTSAVLALLACVLGGLVLAGELLLIPWAARASPTNESGLLAGLLAVMLPYAVLICLAAQVSAVLQGLDRFGWPAFMPSLLNLCWLGGLIAAGRLAPGDQIAQAYVVAGSILVAGCLQLGVQWWVLRSAGFRFHWNWSPVWNEVGGLVRAIVPVTFALSITQINSILDSLIAWSFSRPLDGEPRMPLPGAPRWPLEPGAVSSLYFGERVYQFPLGVFGVALSTVLFPLLARHAARGDYRQLRADLSLSLRLVACIGIPASLGLVLVAEPLTRTVLQHGEFGAADAARTAAMITAYGLGVWAYCGIPVLFRSFYAIGDRAAPLRVGLLAVLLDTVLNLTLIWPLGERGLAFSTAISAAVQVAFLCWLLQRRIGPIEWGPLRRTTIKTLIASGVMVLVCLAIQEFQPEWTSLLAATAWGGPRWGRALGNLLVLVIPVGLAIGAFLAAARALRLEEVWLLIQRSHRENAGRSAGSGPEA